MDKMSYVYCINVESIVVFSSAKKLIKHIFENFSDSEFEYCVWDDSKSKDRPILDFTEVELISLLNQNGFFQMSNRHSNFLVEKCLVE